MIAAVDVKTLVIDGINVSARADQTVLEVARENITGFGRKKAHAHSRWAPDTGRGCLMRSARPRPDNDGLVMK